MCLIIEYISDLLNLFHAFIISYDNLYIVVMNLLVYIEFVAWQQEPPHAAYLPVIGNFPSDFDSLYNYNSFINKE